MSDYPNSGDPKLAHSDDAGVIGGIVVILFALGTILYCAVA